MSNQEIVDAIDGVLPSKIPAKIKELILDAVWDVLNDHLGIDLEPGGSNE